MKRPYATYVFAVVLPAAVAIAAAVQTTASAWREVCATSDGRIAAMTVAAVQHELETRGGSPGQEPEAPLRVVRGVGRATGYEASLYLDGRRVGGTDAAAGPEVLPTALEAAALTAGGTPAGDSPAAGVLVGTAGGPDQPALAVLATPRVPPPGVIPLPLLLVMGLLLMFAVLAGWIQTAGRPEGRASANTASLVLLSLVPALAAGAFLLQLERLFSEHAADATARDLLRALAVANVTHATGSPETVRRLTGFDASLVRDGRVVATTFAEPVPAVAALRAPPSSFTTSGRVPTPAGASAYVSLRVDGGGFLAATAPDPRARIDSFRARARAIAAALGGWLALVALAVALRERRRVSSGR